MHRRFAKAFYQIILLPFVPIGSHIRKKTWLWTDKRLYATFGVLAYSQRRKCVSNIFFVKNININVSFPNSGIDATKIWQFESVVV